MLELPKLPFGATAELQTLLLPINKQTYIQTNKQTNKWGFKLELKLCLAPLWNATAWWKLLEWCHVCDRTLVWWCHCNSRCELWIENLQIVWPLPPSMCIVVLSKNNSTFWISSNLSVLHWNCQDTPKNKCLFRDCFGGRMIWSII